MRLAGLLRLRLAMTAVGADGNPPANGTIAIVPYCSPNPSKARRAAPTSSLRGAQRRGNPDRSLRRSRKSASGAKRRRVEPPSPGLRPPSPSQGGRGEKWGRLPAAGEGEGERGDNFQPPGKGKGERRGGWQSARERSGCIEGGTIASKAERLPSSPTVLRTRQKRGAPPPPRHCEGLQPRGNPYGLAAFMRLAGLLRLRLAMTVPEDRGQKTEDSKICGASRRGKNAKTPMGFPALAFSAAQPLTFLSSVFCPLSSES
jgi:hypothetical protein